MRWQGKELEEYTKKELIVIIEVLRSNIRHQAESHVKQLEKLLVEKGD